MIFEERERGGKEIGERRIEKDDFHTAVFVVFPPGYVDLCRLILYILSIIIF